MTDGRRPEPDFAGTAFQRYAGALHRFLARRLNRPQDVDDLAQEVFIRLAHMSRPELVRKPQAYLFRIAYNLVREFKLRSEKEQEQLTFDSEVVEESAEQPAQVQADELAERLNVQQQLESALARLPRLQRAVLLLVKRDGWSHKEVANRTGLNVRVVERYVIEATARMMTMDWDR